PSTLPPPAGRVREGVSSRRLLLRARRCRRVLRGIYGLTRRGRRSTPASTQLGQAPPGRLAAALSGLERRAVHVRPDQHRLDLTDRPPAEARLAAPHELAEDHRR